MLKNILIVLVCVLAIGSFYFYKNFSIFVVQPIGAIPEGATFIVPRTANLAFVDSADALCERLMQGVSLMCRVTMLTQAVDPDEIYFRLPYQEWLYSYSTGGRSYGS